MLCPEPDEGSLCFGKSEVYTSIFFDFFLSKSFFKNVMEYALPEVTIGVKRECVCNGNKYCMQN